jgi:ubiquinone/menaquinone biosynthesis C-methylase UbiE
LPELYERFLVEPLFRPFAEELLRRASLRHEDRVLDVACGTGIVARLAQQTVRDRGSIVGIDASPGMLAAARAAAPGIDWREGDAGRLPIDDHSFDLVTCHQGLQFFPDKPAAIKEMRRVLAPDGRVALATWRPVDEVPLVRDLQRVAERHVGPIVDQRHSLGDAGAIRTLLTDAGFRAIHIETVARRIRMSGDPGVFARLNAMAVVGMSAAAKTMTDEQRAEAIAAVAADSVEALQPFIAGSDLVFEISSNIAVSRLT